MNKIRLYISNISFWIAVVFYYLEIWNDILLRNMDYTFGIFNGLMFTNAMFYLYYSIYFFSRSLIIEKHHFAYPFVLCSIIGLFELVIASFISGFGCDDVTLGLITTTSVKQYCQKFPLTYNNLWFIFSGLFFTISILSGSFYIKKKSTEKIDIQSV